MVMIFAHPKVRAYLLEHGRVYTFRKLHPKTLNGIRRKMGKDWATDKRGGKKIADIEVTLIALVDVENMELILTKYVKESGFTGCGKIEAETEWARAIGMFNPRGPPDGWIYKVEIQEAEKDG